MEPPRLHLVLDLLQQLVTFKISFLAGGFYNLEESSLAEKGTHWNEYLTSTQLETKSWKINYLRAYLANFSSSQAVFPPPKFLLAVLSKP